MKSHQERVVKEMSELDVKISKIRKFIGGVIFPTIPRAEQILMKQQEVLMVQYSRILAVRIAGF